MNYAKVLLDLLRLKQNEKKSAEQMRRMQEKNLRKLLASLYNFAQPLIRYEITDHLVLKEPLSGSPFSRAEILLGRDEDMLWFEDGNGNRDFLHPLAVEGFCIEGLRDYQFRKTSRFVFEMLAEVPQESRQAAVRQEILDRMEHILKEKKLMHVRFHVRFVKEILPDSRTGKKPLILSESREVAAV